MIYVFLKLAVGKKGKFKTLNALDGKKELKSITSQISFEGENECAERKFFFFFLPPPREFINLVDVACIAVSIQTRYQFQIVTSFLPWWRKMELAK